MTAIPAAMAKEKNVKVSFVYRHEPPNVPRKSIKGVLVEYGPCRATATPVGANASETTVA